MRSYITLFLVSLVASIQPTKSESSDNNFESHSPSNSSDGKGYGYKQCKYTKAQCVGNSIMSCKDGKDLKKECGSEKKCKLISGKPTCTPLCDYRGTKCKGNTVVQCGPNGGKEQVVDTCKKGQKCIQQKGGAFCGCDFKGQRCSSKKDKGIICENGRIHKVIQCVHKDKCYTDGPWATCQQKKTSHGGEQKPHVGGRPKPGKGAAPVNWRHRID